MIQREIFFGVIINTFSKNHSRALHFFAKNFFANRIYDHKALLLEWEKEHICTSIQLQKAHNICIYFLVMTLLNCSNKKISKQEI